MAGSPVALLFSFLLARNDVPDEARKTGDSLTAMAAKVNVASTLHQAAMAGVYTGLAGAGAEAVAFVTAAAPVAGVIAAVPAVAFAGATSLTALAVGFHGVAAAMKATSSSAGPSADSIAAAERRVAAAQRSATQAQVGINAAREEAVRRIRDASLALAHASLDQREASLAVSDAERTLADARRSGDQNAVMHAELALAEARQGVIDVQARLADATDENNKRQAQGVEGSDEVTQATQKQADAVQELADAQRALAQSGSGGAGGAEAYSKLAPAARQLVDALHALGPAWTQTRQATQQSLLSGVGPDVKALGDTYLPHLQGQLAAVASGWNTGFRQTAALARTPEFIADVNTSLGNTAAFSREAGKALAPFIDGLRQIGTAGSVFLPRMGVAIHNIATGFDRWATSARETGRVNRWIENGITTAKSLWAILVNVAQATASIFRAGDAGPGFLATMERGTAIFAAWTASVQGQNQLHEFFASLRDVAGSLWTVVGAVATALVQSGPGISTVSAYFSILGAVAKVVADNMDLIRPILPLLVIAFVTYKTALVNARIAQGALNLAMKLGILNAKQLEAAMAIATGPIGLIVAAIIGLVAVFVLLWNKSAGFRDFWKGLWRDIQLAGQLAWEFLSEGWQNFAKIFTVDFWTGGFKIAVNGIITGVDWIIAHFNSAIIDSINSVSKYVGIPAIPHIPEIPHLAKGGIVPATPGGRLIVAGEGGEDEIVAPLSALAGGGGTVRVQLIVNGAGSDPEMEAFVVKMIKRYVRVKAGKRANSVQLALGQ